MAVEVAAAYVSIIPSFRGFQRAVDQELRQIDVGGAGRRSGEQFQDAFGRSSRPSGGNNDRSGPTAGLQERARESGRRSGSGFAEEMRGEITGGMGPIGTIIERAMGGAGDSGAQGFLGKFKGAALAGIAGVAVAVAAAGVAAFNEAMEVKNQRLKDQAAFGWSPEQSARLGKVAGELYSSGYGEGLAEINNQVSTVVGSITGLTDATDETMKKVTGYALSFAEVFEIDIDRAVNSTNLLLSSGLADNAEHAFDLMTASLQKVGPAMREPILDASDEYGQFFSKLGFSGEEAFGALVSASEMGEIGIDKAGDAIKEFTIRSTDMSTASQEAYQSIGLDAHEMSNAILAGGDTARDATNKIIDGLLGIQDPAAQSAAAIALFGTPVEDLGVHQIPQFLEALSAAGGGIGDVTGAAKEMDETFGGTVTGVEKLWRSIKTSVVDFFIDKVIPVFNTAADWLSNNLGPAFAKVGQWISENVMPALEKFGQFFGEVIVPRLQMFWSFIQDNILPILQRLWEGVQSTIGNIISIFSGLIDFVAGIFTGDWSRAWEGIKGIFSGIWDQMKNAVSIVWDTIKGVIEAAWVYIRDIIFKPIGDALSTMGGWFSALWDKIAEVWGWIQDKLTTVWTFIRDNIFAPLYSGIETLIGWYASLWTKVSEVWQWIQDKIGAVWTWIRDNVFAPLYSGVETLIRWFGDLWTKVSDVWTWIQDKLGAVWGWIKENIFDPIERGIQSIMDFFQSLWDKVVEVWDAIGAKVSEVWDKTIAPIWETVKQWIDSIGSFFDGVKTAIGDAVTAIAGFIIEIKDSVMRFFEWLKNPTEEIPGIAVRASSPTDLNGMGYYSGGGILPGSDPGRGRDNQLIWGRSEEAVMVPEWQKAVGGALTVHRWNRAAERGQLAQTMLGDLTGYADGGIVGVGSEARRPLLYSLGIQAINDRVDQGITERIRQVLQQWADAVMVAPSSGFTGGINPSQDPSSFGWERAKGIVPFSWNGHAFVGGVADRTQGLWQGLMDALVPQIPGGIMAPIWAYENRQNVNSPGNASFHSYGLAADINAPQNPNGAPGRGRSGPGVIPAGPAHALAARFGMVWGGDFSGTPDPMHFEIHVSPDQITGGSGGPPGVEGGPFPPMVERWRSLGLDVLGQVGRYKGLSLTQHIDRMLNQIRTESSGDPNAINTTDINAQRGDPSIGLLQVIGETFRNALRGTPFANLIAAGQRDPRASMTASTLYSLGRYGSLERAWRGVAYDSGGWIYPGLTPVANLTGKPEAVLTPAQSVALIALAHHLETGSSDRIVDLLRPLIGGVALAKDGSWVPISFYSGLDSAEDAMSGVTAGAADQQKEMLKLNSSMDEYLLRMNEQGSETEMQDLGLQQLTETYQSATAAIVENAEAMSGASAAGGSAAPVTSDNGPFANVSTVSGLNAMAAQMGKSALRAHEDKWELTEKYLAKSGMTMDEFILGKLLSGSPSELADLGLTELAAEYRAKRGTLTVRDSGGWMRPGEASINLTRRPEAVLSPPQSDALITQARHLEAGFGGGQDPAALRDALVGMTLELATDAGSFRATLRDQARQVIDARVAAEVRR